VPGTSKVPGTWITQLVPGTWITQLLAGEILIR